MHRTLAGLLSGVLLAITGLVAGAPTAVASGTQVEPSVEVRGGNVIQHGEAAWIILTVNCPKGDSWHINEQSNVFVFSTTGLDDTYASTTDFRTRKCTGKPHSVKIKIVNFHGPPIPRACTGEYGFSVVFTGSVNKTVVIGRGGADPATGPLICLS